MRLGSFTKGRAELSAIIGFLAYLSSSDSLIDIPLCLSRVLGRRCPTCGTVRSLWHIMHGELTKAWSLNPIGYIAIVILARRAIVLCLPRRQVASHSEHDRLDVALLASYLILGSMRMMGTV
jgi:hypothetical protein